MNYPPSDTIRPGRKVKLTDADAARLIAMRRNSEVGAIELFFHVFARPAGSSKAPSKIPSGSRSLTVYSAMNAEQIINGGPTAGLQFAAPQALLAFYEQTKERKPK